jgi:hypothetical protein
MTTIFERVELYGGPFDGMRCTLPIDDDAAYQFQGRMTPGDISQFAWYRRTPERTADGFTVWRLSGEPKKSL